MPHDVTLLPPVALEDDPPLTLRSLEDFVKTQRMKAREERGSSVEEPPARQPPSQSGLPAALEACDARFAFVKAR